MTTTLQEQVLPVKTKSMDICLISANGPDAVGGLASYVRGLAEGLSQENKITVISRFNRVSSSNQMYISAELPCVIDRGKYQLFIIAPGNLWRPILQRLVSLVSRPRLQPLAKWIYSKAYRHTLVSAIPKAPDVVHYIGNGWEMLGFAALSEARQRGARFTMLPAVHPGTWGDGPLDVSLYNQADAVFVLSDSERQHLINFGVEPSRLHICGLAPAPAPEGDGSAFRHKHGLNDRPMILYIGRKDRAKGYHVLREAMVLVLAAVPEACLVVIGPDREPPYPPVPKNGLLDLGQADEKEKADALAACDIFCLPSAHESFGIVYVEAWAYVKPVVGGPAPAVKELISEGVNGYCVAQNKDAIADALIRLIQNPLLRQQLGVAGRILQQDRFTWNSVLKFHEEVFKSLA